MELTSLHAHMYTWGKLTEDIDFTSCFLISAHKLKAKFILTKTEDRGNCVQVLRENMLQKWKNQIKLRYKKVR